MTRLMMIFQINFDCAAKITAVLNTAERKSVSNESHGSQRIAVRKEYVTETFLDVDGFMGKLSASKGVDKFFCL